MYVRNNIGVGLSISDVYDLATGAAKDIARDVFANFNKLPIPDGLKQGIYNLAENIVDLGDTRQGWQDYFLSSTNILFSRWEAVRVVHAGFMQNRKNLGIPLFNEYQAPPTPEYSAVHPGWTQDDEAYLNQVYEIVVKIYKYTEDLKKGIRGIAWDASINDAGVLGSDLEPLITTGQAQGTTVPANYSPNEGDILLTNFKSKGSQSVISPGFLGQTGIELAVGALIVITVTVGAVLMCMKICDTIKDYLARAEAADIRDKNIQLISSGKATPEQVVQINKSQADAIKTQEQARAESNKSTETSKALGTLETIAWVALGITVIGGASYAIYKFTRPSYQLAYPSYPMLPMGQPMIEAEVVGSRNV